MNELTAAYKKAKFEKASALDPNRFKGNVTPQMERMYEAWRSAPGEVGKLETETDKILKYMKSVSDSPDPTTYAGYTMPQLLSAGGYAGGIGTAAYGLHGIGGGASDIFRRAVPKAPSILDIQRGLEALPSNQRVSHIMDRLQFANPEQARAVRSRLSQAGVPELAGVIGGADDASVRKILETQVTKPQYDYSRKRMAKGQKMRPIIHDVINPSVVLAANEAGISPEKMLKRMQRKGQKGSFKTMTPATAPQYTRTLKSKGSTIGDILKQKQPSGQIARQSLTGSLARTPKRSGGLRRIGRTAKGVGKGALYSALPILLSMLWRKVDPAEEKQEKLTGSEQAFRSNEMKRIRQILLRREIMKRFREAQTSEQLSDPNQMYLDPEKFIPLTSTGEFYSGMDRQGPIDPNDPDGIKKMFRDYAMQTMMKQEVERIAAMAKKK